MIPNEEGVPLIGVIAPLTDNKGFDILADCIHDVLKLKVQFVLMGEGEPKYRKLFESIHKRYDKKVGIITQFDNSLAHQIIAGSDMFLAPSRHEACGDYHMYSLLYGTIPIVHATGVLADTVKNFNASQGSGNGFVFEHYTSKELLKTMKRAIKVYADEKVWTKLMKCALKSNFSWKSATTKHIRLYSKLEMAKRK